MLWSGVSSWPLHRPAAFLPTGSLGQPWSTPGPSPSLFHYQHQNHFTGSSFAGGASQWDVLDEQASFQPGSRPHLSDPLPRHSHSGKFSHCGLRVYVNSSRIYSNCEQVVNIEVFQNKEPVNLMQLKLSELPSTYGPLPTNFSRCPSHCPNILHFCFCTGNFLTWASCWSTTLPQLLLVELCRRSPPLGKPSIPLWKILFLTLFTWNLDLGQLLIYFPSQALKLEVCCKLKSFIQLIWWKSWFEQSCLVIGHRGTGTSYSEVTSPWKLFRGEIALKRTGRLFPSPPAHISARTLWQVCCSPLSKEFTWWRWMSRCEARATLYVFRYASIS